MAWSLRDLLECQTEHLEDINEDHSSASRRKTKDACKTSLARSTWPSTCGLHQTLLTLHAQCEVVE
eukprot:1076223-Rhodomonas_salina.4